MDSAQPNPFDFTNPPRFGRGPGNLDQGGPRFDGPGPAAALAPPAAADDDAQ